MNSCLVFSILLASSAIGSKDSEQKRQVLQAVFSHPSIQLHYYPEYLRAGKEQIVIVAPKSCSGLPMLLFDKKLTVQNAAPAMKVEKGLIFKITKLSVSEKQAEVEGEFPAQGLYFNATVVKAHGRWLAAYMYDVLRKK